MITIPYSRNEMAACVHASQNVGPPALFIAVALFSGHQSTCHSWKSEEKRRFKVFSPDSVLPKLHTFRILHTLAMTSTLRAISGGTVYINCSVVPPPPVRLRRKYVRHFVTADSCYRTTYRLYRHRVTILHRHLSHAQFFIKLNILRLRYNAQPVNAVWGNSRCLLWEPYGTHKYTSK
jgi:hypothetical protein